MAVRFDVLFIPEIFLSSNTDGKTTGKKKIKKSKRGTSGKTGGSGKI
jgi:hypothetical protein